MSSITREVWGRKLKLEVYPEGGKSQSDAQSLALERLCSAWDVVNKSASKLKKYCAKDGDGGDMENVFRYVMPRYLFLPKTQRKRTVALMCDYRFDPEHGIALVFENETLREIGPQDIIL
ncbi:MAG: hypothetical protein LKE37_09865 [Atopobiaceae bacterium]|jgi:hypothetical protein|nr:hypothetical protein [Atopobiaceae bacterium]